MRPEEVAAVGDLAAEALGGAVEQIHDVHAGIARRVFWAIGDVAAPVRLLHDGIAGLTYRSVRGIGTTVLRTGALAASATLPADAPSIESRPLGRVAVGILNGAFGDALERRHSPLAVEMTVRWSGLPVEPVAEALARAFPDAAPRIAVFLHGVGQTEDAWTRRADRVPPYGHRLQTELGYTPVYVRYNSGRPISENGRDLARLLAQIHRAWPTEIDEISLVGHSMGGQVARSACWYGAELAWAQRLRHVVSLGSPHGGEIKLLPTANHHFVSARRSRDPHALLGRLLQLDLLNHPAIGRQLVRWLGGPPALPAPASSGQRP
jgi:pimeloyl-ACP methyl ester carboxylesterase